MDTKSFVIGGIAMRSVRCGLLLPMLRGLSVCLLDTLVCHAKRLNRSNRGIDEGGSKEPRIK